MRPVYTQTMTIYSVFFLLSISNGDLHFYTRLDAAGKSLHQAWSWIHYNARQLKNASCRAERLSQTLLAANDFINMSQCSLKTQRRAYLIDVICLTTSCGEWRSMRRLWILQESAVTRVLINFANFQILQEFPHFEQPWKCQSSNAPHFAEETQWPALPS